jgi:hypothetical protein
VFEAGEEGSCGRTCCSARDGRERLWGVRAVAEGGKEVVPEDLEGNDVRFFGL